MRGREAEEGGRADGVVVVQWMKGNETVSAANKQSDYSMYTNPLWQCRLMRV